MGFLDDLRKKASQVYDQANIFDNGLSYQTRQVQGPQRNIAQQAYRPADVNLVQPARQTFSHVVNTGAAGAASVLGLANAGYQSVFGNDQSYQNAIDSTQATVDEFLNRGAYLNPTQARSQGTGLQGFKNDFAKPVIQGTSEVGPWVAPIGGIGQGGKLLTRVASQAAANAVVGGASSAGSQYAQTGHINPRDVAKSAGLGAAIGAAYPVVGAGGRLVGREAGRIGEDGYIRMPEGKQVDEPLFHGSKNANLIEQEGFKVGDKPSNGNIYGQGVYLTSNRRRAAAYADAVNRSGGRVLKIDVPKDAKIYHPKNPLRELFSRDTNYGDPALITDKFKKLGYDGIELGRKNSREVVVFDAKNAKVAGGKTKPLTLYHGSDKPIDKFDLTKAGTGEGVDAYGQNRNLFGNSAYLTDNKKAADSYALEAAKRKYRTTYDDRSLTQQGWNFKPNADARAAKEKVVSSFVNKGKIVDTTKLKVDDKILNVIADNLDNGFPKDINLQQLQAVRDNIRAGKYNGTGNELTDLLTHVGGGKPGQATADYFKAQGYDGIKFPTGQREGAKGFNYAVFNPDKLETAARKSLLSDERGSIAAGDMEKQIEAGFKKLENIGKEADKLTRRITKETKQNKTGSLPSSSPQSLLKSVDKKLALSDKEMGQPLSGDTKPTLKDTSLAAFAGKTRTPRPERTAKGNLRLKDMRFPEPTKYSGPKPLSQPPKLPIAKTNGDAYEATLATALRKQGGKVIETGKTAGRQDGGVDLIHKHPDGTTELIQAKYRSRDTTIHLGTLAQIDGAAARYRAEHPRETVQPAVYATKPLDADALAYAKSNGIKVVQTGLKGEKVAQQKAVAAKPTGYKITETDKIAIQNSIPVADRADFLGQLANKNSDIAKRLSTATPDTARQIVRRYYEGKNPFGSFELNQAKAVGAKLAKASTPAEIQKIIGTGNTTLMKSLREAGKDKAFVKQLADTRTKSGIRDLINSKLKNPVYSPIGGGGKPPVPPKKSLSSGSTPLGPNERLRKLPQSIRNSATTDKKLAAIVEDSGYTVKPNKETLANAYVALNRDPMAFVDEVSGMKIGKKNNFADSSITGHALPDADQVAKSMVAIDYLARRGLYKQANHIVENLSKQSTTLGQAVQILSAYSRTTPVGIYRYAQNLAKDAGVTLDKPKLDSLVKQAKAIEKMPEGRGQEVARAKLLKEAMEVVPSSKTDKASMILYMAQLLNAKTAGRNILGNALQLVAQDAADVIATPVDAVRSAVRHTPRQVYLPNPIKQAKSFGTGLKYGAQDAMMGVDTRSMLEGKYGVRKNVFQNRLGRGLEKTMGLELGATDRAFYQVAHDQMLNNLMRGAKIKEPTPEMRAQADAFGRYMTYQDDTALAKMASGLKKTLNLNKSFGAGNFIINYPKTPANLINRAAAFSPLGFAKGIAEAYRLTTHKPGATPMAVEQAFARAAVGTAGLYSMGYLMRNLGILQANENKNKTDLTAFQKATGGGQYTINTSALKRYVESGFDEKAAKKRDGDRTVSYDWAQPLAVSLTMGASVADNRSSTKSSSQKIKQTVGNVGADAAAGMQTIVEQPLLQGVQRAFGAQDPMQGLISTAENTPNSFVPALVRQTRQFTDNTTRNTYDPNLVVESKNLVQNSIPGASKSLPAQINPSTGQPNQTYQNGNNWFNTYFNPAFTSTIRHNDVTGEINRLYDNNGDRNVVPNVVSKSYQIDGKTRVLSSDEYNRMQQFVGKEDNARLQQAMQNPLYQQADDKTKAGIVGNILQGVTSDAKKSVLGTKSDPATSINSVLSNATAKAARDKFDTSGQKSATIGDTFYYRDKQGNIHSQPQILRDYSLTESKLNLTLDRAKASKDVNTWLTAATQKMQALEKKRAAYDPATQQDELDKITLAQENLRDEMAKYTSYGGFTKGSSTKVGSSRKPLSSSSTISLVGSLNKRVASSKVSAPKVASSIRGRSIKAFKKPTGTNVAVKKNTIRRNLA